MPHGHDAVPRGMYYTFDGMVVLENGQLPPGTEAGGKRRLVVTRAT